MSKQIDLSQPLSKEDEAYLYQLNQHDVIAAMKAGETPQPQMSGMSTGTLTGEEPPSTRSPADNPNKSAAEVAADEAAKKAAAKPSTASTDKK
jgi:hypothetical protein